MVKIMIMEIHNPKEIFEKIRRKSSQYLIVGVDLYRTHKCALEDKAKLDTSRPYSYTFGATFFCADRTNYFHSGRFLEVIDLVDKTGATYLPCNDAKEAKKILMCRRANKFSVLNKEVVEDADVDRAYVLTPLTERELSELLVT